jgi:hypothetical protein
VTDTLDQFASLMNGIGLRWALIGGQAVNAWVEPRFTRGDEEPPLDVQVAKTRFQVQLLDRAVGREDGEVPVATAEDIIVLKLIAWRDKDEVDLQALSKVTTLDWEYVERWAREWEMLDRLDFLRRRQDIVREQRAKYEALRKDGRPPDPD